MLEVKNLTVRYGARVVVNNVDFALGANRWLMVVGPNGAGKTTVVNAISQGVPYSGSVQFNGQNLAGMRPAALARSVGVLSQNRALAYSFTVGEVVQLGRYAHAPGLFSAPDEGGAESVETALHLTGMLPFQHQSVLALSGGEVQRAFLAQVFAQDPALLILDEPTNHLDLVYQKQIFGLIEEWIRRPGRSVISVVHDLSLARAYGTDVLLMDAGRVVGAGAAKDVLSRANMERVYGMDVHAWMRQMLRHWEEE